MECHVRLGMYTSYEINFWIVLERIIVEARKTETDMKSCACNQGQTFRHEQAATSLTPARNYPSHLHFTVIVNPASVGEIGP
jgi:hypothetical protein